MTHRLKRIAFKKDHIHKPLEFWRTVILSDEDKFCIFGLKGCKLVWRKPCTALQNEHLVPKYARLRFYVKAVTPKCLGGPPVDRFNAHPDYANAVTNFKLREKSIPAKHQICNISRDRLIAKTIAGLRTGHYRGMKFDRDDSKYYRNCDNCLDTELTPAPIFDCPAILAAL
ncbi:uncharacterized protein TNCV_1478681 [Trichonephila clavipes]|nr:uncharacterized protein TNCV_1478681 [Trichonephila clavipes]